MRIHSLQLEHFGKYDAFQLTAEQLSAPITIIYGPNEVGKSTLHAFIRSMLFGFRHKGYVQQTYANQSTFGRLVLDMGTDGLVQIERQMPPMNGKVTVYHGQQREEGEAALKKWIGGISAPLFSNIFCFSHQELQHLETLQGEEVAAYLHSAAMGAGGINLLDIERRMGKAQEQLFKPRASIPELNQLLTQLEQEQQQILELQRELDRYQPLQQELVQATENLQQLKETRGLLDRERSLYEITLQAYDIRQKQKHTENMVAELQKQDYMLVPKATHIEHLHKEEAAIQDKKLELIRLEDELKHLHDHMQQRVSSLGGNWTIEKVSRLDLSIPKKDQLLKCTQQYESMEERLEGLKEKWSEKKQAALRAKQKWQDLKQQHEEHAAKIKQMEQERGQNRKQHHTDLVWIWTLLGGLALSLFYLTRGLALEAAALVTGTALLVFILFRKMKRQKKGEFEWQNFIQKQELQSSQDSYLLASAKQEAENAQNEEQDYALKISESEEALRVASHLGRELYDSLGFSFPLKLHSIQAMIQSIEQIQKDLVYQDRLQKKKDQLEQDIQLWEKQVQSLNDTLHGGEQNENILTMDPLMKHLKMEQENERQVLEQMNLLTQFSAEFNTLISQLPDSGVKELESVLGRSTRQEIEETINQLLDKYHQVIEQIEEQAQHIGHLKQELTQLETEDSLTSLQVQFEEKKARFREKAKSWAAYAVAKSLCQSTRRIYEEERQPALLQRASHFFSQITHQRYMQVIAPIGEQELVVIDQHGKRWNSVQLSRGAQEQLYLAMRFALIKEYEQQASLPIIMDDPFVHFDHDRLKEIFQSMPELASSHQIILFTCHEHYLDLWQDTGMKANIIPLSQKSKYQSIT